MTNQTIAALALDLGTTSIKAGLMDASGSLISNVSLPSPQIEVNDGRYESDAIKYAETAEKALGTCIALAHGCITLGICCQRSSFLIWERASGNPFTPLISWQDTRGELACEELRDHGSLIHYLTGLPLAPYYFAPKLRVVLQENPDWKSRLACGELLAGTLDTFLIWRWSGGRYFVTDASMAARTLLMDVRTSQWSQKLCDLFDISMEHHPQIMNSAGMMLRLDNGLVLQASVGDQSAALFSGIAENKSEVLVNLGTGCFVARYQPAAQTALAGYLSTLVYRDKKSHVHFAIEGTLNSIVAALTPYPVSECRVEDLARDDIYCIAEPSGLGAPYFRNDLGITFSQPVEHLSPKRIAALLLEAVIFRVTRILEEFQRELPLQSVFLSGGLSEVICLKQGIAQCVSLEVYRLLENESSLQGAAMLAAGMTPVSNRRAERIAFTGNTNAVREKYVRWKLWLDEMIGEIRVRGESVDRHLDPFASCTIVSGKNPGQLD